MIPGHILSKALRDLHDITGTGIVLTNRKGDILADFQENPVQLPDVTDFIHSAADRMAIGELSLLKILDGEHIEFVLITYGPGSEVTARIAASELENLLTVSHERQDRSRFIQNILMDNLLPIDLRDSARKLKVKDDVTRAVLLVETTEADNDVALQTLKALYNPQGNTFITGVDPTHIAVVLEADNQDQERNELRKCAFTIADTLNMEAMISVRVSYGEPKDQLLRLSQSFKESQLAMEVGRIFYPDRHVISYGRLGIGRLIYQLPTSLCSIFLKETFDHDIFQELDDETLTTIRHFFANNLNISETARQLYIHRNTLVYRIEKLEKITGLDIRKFDEAMTFKIAMMVYDYLKNAEGRV